MKLKNKGRKIYKTKEKNYYGKSPIGKLFSALLTIILIGGIGVLGYSVAGPMIDYSRKQGDEEPQETTSAEETTTGISSENATNPTTVETPETEIYKGVRLNEYEIMTTEAMETAIGRVPQNIEYIEIPLKLSDGRIIYDTGYEEFPEQNNSGLTLSEITRTVRKNGYTPVAYISVFADNIIPAEYPQYSYMNTENLTVWHDADFNMWVSPFSAEYSGYLNFIADEISGAGFKKIICSDIKFPDFSDMDLSLLNDSRLESYSRYTALDNVADMLYDIINYNNSDMIIEVNSSEILSGKAEILNQQIKADTVVVGINLDEITAGVNTGSTVYEFTGTATENITKMLDLIKDDISDFNVIIRISGTSHNTSDLLRAVDDIAQTGWESFIIG